jgi:hypothetical protein
MVFQWFAFFITTTIAYCGIAVFAQMTGGGSTGALQAFLAIFRPIPFFVILIANMLFSVGVYYGFTVTRYTIPIATAVGVVTTYLYSIIVLGASVSALKIIGIAAIIIGIVLLSL